MKVRVIKPVVINRVESLQAGDIGELVDTTPIYGFVKFEGKFGVYVLPRHILRHPDNREIAHNSWCKTHRDAERERKHAGK